MKLRIQTEPLKLEDVCRFVFRRSEFSGIEISEDVMFRAGQAQKNLYKAIEKGLPIYGVTTGFGDSCFRVVDPTQSETLQANLVAYLLCGTGPIIPLEASRAMFLIRLKSLSRGHSGVSPELLARMQMYLERDWVPVVPCEGSLGASGDLIPLAYLAECLQGRGQIFCDGKIRATEEVLKEAGVEPYTLKAKEGLALVNGTSTMAGMFLNNLISARYLLKLAYVSSAWLCLALKGRTEPFEALVNEKASRHPGQAASAREILKLLNDEKYRNKPLEDVEIRGMQTVEQVQDRYSLRCSPQILGPVRETIQQLEVWLRDEINGVADNPLIDEDGRLGMGGNFYGGYLSQGMDYLKISLAHIADMLDRQIASLIDEKANRGLPANLANWPGLPREQHHLHHGLKGLHQSISAITSEIMQKATPGSTFSRSAESHNQDKVSLGMSAAVQSAAQIDQLYSIFSMALICLAQGLDLRKVQLCGAASVALYETIRKTVPFVAHDQPLHQGIKTLSEKLRRNAHQESEGLNETL